MERQRYDAALSALVNDVIQVVIAHETHTDKNASRRREAWGKRN